MWYSIRGKFPSHTMKSHPRKRRGFIDLGVTVSLLIAAIFAIGSPMAYRWLEKKAAEVKIGQTAKNPQAK